MTFRTLIIGGGFGSRVMKGCYEEAGMTVEVVTPRDTERLRKLCAQPFELVSVHSPPFLHAEHVSLALDHGHNVLCDKPFGVSAKQADQMLNHARQAGAIHLLNFEFRLDPGRTRVKEIVDSGQIGKVIHISWNFFTGFSRIPLRKYGWHFDKNMGGGWIRINASHMIDMVRWMVGEIVEADVRTRIELKERPDRDGKVQTGTAEDAFSAFLKTDTGATVCIDTGWATNGTLPDRWTVIGTEGIIDVAERMEFRVQPLVRDTEIKIITGAKETVEHVGPFEGDVHLPAMRPWAKTVRQAIEQRRQIAPSFEDGLACSKVIDMMLMSANR